MLSEIACTGIKGHTFRIFACGAEETQVRRLAFVDAGCLLHQGPESSMDHVLGGEGRCARWGEGADTFLALNDSSPLVDKSSKFWCRTGSCFSLWFSEHGWSTFLWHAPLVLSWSRCFVAICQSRGAAGERAGGPSVPPPAQPGAAAQPGVSALIERLRGGKVSGWKEPLS